MKNPMEQVASWEVMCLVFGSSNNSLFEILRRRCILFNMILTATVALKGAPNSEAQNSEQKTAKHPGNKKDISK